MVYDGKHLYAEHYSCAVVRTTLSQAGSENARLRSPPAQRDKCALDLISVAPESFLIAGHLPCEILPSSINAINFSSARTMKHFPLSRWASAIQIVRPLESIAKTQPQLQPALLRLSAMISQFFIRFRAIALMIMPGGLNCGFEFEKGRQLLICMHNKASGVAALCGDNPN
jgi:hypothetical protein